MPYNPNGNCVGRKKNTPDIHIEMSKICGCVILYGNRNLESIIKIKGLEMEAIAWLNQVARFHSVNVHAFGNMG